MSGLFESEQAARQFELAMLDYDRSFLPCVTGSGTRRVCSVERTEGDWNQLRLENERVLACVAVEHEQRRKELRNLVLREDDGEYQAKWQEWDAKVCGSRPWDVSWGADKVKWRQYVSERQHKLWEAHLALLAHPEPVQEHVHVEGAQRRRRGCKGGRRHKRGGASEPTPDS